MPVPRSSLHIRCGDDILGTLDRGGVPGDKAKWADILCEGPIPAVEDEARRKVRAAYLARRYSIAESEAARHLLEEDQRVDGCERYKETVLWFEADLFDQIILVYLLARLARTAPRARLSLICIGRYPGVRRFIGLGQLTSEQLVRLLPERRPVTPEQQRLAARVWDALRSDDPRGLLPFATMRSRALPFLPAAVRRYLEQYPWTGDGLSLTERYALQTLAKAGELSGSELFVRVQDRERRPFMGDGMFFAVLHDLAQGRSPLIESGATVLRAVPMEQLFSTPIRLTRAGERVLEARADWRKLNGVGKWIGGVHVRGKSQWRWSPAKGRVVRTGR